MRETKAYVCMLSQYIGTCIHQYCKRPDRAALLLMLSRLDGCSLEAHAFMIAYASAGWWFLYNF